MMRCFPADESDFESDLYSRCFCSFFNHRIHVSLPLRTNFVQEIASSAQGGICSDHNDSHRASDCHRGYYLHHSLDFYVQKVGISERAVNVQI